MTLLFRSCFIENAFKQERLQSSLMMMAAVLALTTLTQIVIGVRSQGVLSLSGYAVQSLTRDGCK